MPEITVVDQEPPNYEQQDQITPDDNKNENDINYGTEEVGDLIEETLNSNNDLKPQGKEPEKLLYTPVTVTRRSIRLNKPVSRIIMSFYGKKYDTAATLISREHMFETVHPDTHMRLSQGIDYDHVVFYAMTQVSMKVGMRQWGEPETEAFST